MKYLTTILFLLTVVLTSAQDLDDANYFFKDNYEYHFYGKVKSIRRKYSYIKPNISTLEYNDINLRADATPKFDFYYYPTGQCKTFWGGTIDTVYQQRKKDIYTYYYDNSIFKKKIICNLKKRYLNVFDKPLLPRYDYCIKSLESGEDKEVFRNAKFSYILDKQNRILFENEYEWVYSQDSIQSLRDSKKIIHSVGTYYYNEKSQVIKIIYSIKLNPKYDIDRVNINFLRTDFELNEYNPEMVANFKYDAQGRIVFVSLTAEEELLCSEEYVYHPKLDYVEKAIYYDIKGEYSSKIKKTVRYYNEYGDLIQIDFLPDYEGQPMTRVSRRPRYYDYEYDDHKNWIKCYMYLEGTKEGKPSLIAEREIIYYDE